MDIEELVKELIATTRGIIAQKYSDWGYHNLEHFEETIAAVDKLRNKIKRREWLLLMIAVAFHDIVKGNGSGKDEKLSAAMAEEWMVKKGIFAEEEISLVREMIMGTVATFTGGWRMHQAAEDSSNLLVRLMADVDLVNMGAEWGRFKLRIEGLWQECGHKEEGEMEMWQQQKLFFENREYLTSYIKEISPHLEENKQRINDLLAKKSEVLE